MFLVSTSLNCYHLWYSRHFNQVFQVSGDKKNAYHQTTTYSITWITVHVVGHPVVHIIRVSRLDSSSDLTKHLKLDLSLHLDFGL